MYEPAQDSASGESYDSSPLTSAAAVAIAAHEDEEETNAVSSQPDVSEDVLRALRVAELLGLRLVGWCLSHGKVQK